MTGVIVPQVAGHGAAWEVGLDMTVWVTQTHQDLHDPQRAHLHALHRFPDLSAAAARFSWTEGQAQRAPSTGLVYCVDGLDHTIICRPRPPAETIRRASRPWSLHLHHADGHEVVKTFPGAVTSRRLASFVTRSEKAFSLSRASS
ncbi:hypothetical protein [Streptomyces sp. YS-3]|uniref:hypothetical protein n=1 Tax=Streptomyces sp. YS-3 TaxID=3381352 RepID=UPI0038629E35